MYFRRKTADYFRSNFSSIQTLILRFGYLCCHWQGLNIFPVVSSKSNNNKKVAIIVVTDNSGSRLLWYRDIPFLLERAVFPCIGDYGFGSPKALLHEAIFSATCNTTDDESSASEVSLCTCICICTLKLISQLIFATHNAIFRCETRCDEGVLHVQLSPQTCLATPLHCEMQKKLPRVTAP